MREDKSEEMRVEWNESKWSEGNGGVRGSSNVAERKVEIDEGRKKEYVQNRIIIIWNSTLKNITDVTKCNRSKDKPHHTTPHHNTTQHTTHTLTSDSGGVQTDRHHPGEQELH